MRASSSEHRANLYVIYFTTASSSEYRPIYQ